MWSGSIKTRIVWRFTLGGMLFGCAFPLAAWILDLCAHCLPASIAAIVALHRANPIHLIVDISPMVLGITFYLIGVRQARIEALNEELTRKVAKRTAHLEAASIRLRAREAELRAANQQLTHEVLRQTREVERRTTHDPLTGLPNRASLAEQLGSALDRAHREKSQVAVLHVDLDHFGLINDSLGHEIGDQLLRTVAERLCAVSGSDQGVFRISGDEFIVMTDPGAREESASELAERLLAALSQPVRLAEHDHFPSASVGVAVMAGPARNLPRVLRHADAAMRATKDAGGAGYAVYDPSMSSQALQRVDLEAALRFAILNKQLRVYYQPLVDLSTGDTTGFEALVRWDRPGHGIVSPGKFIPLAEQTGQIVQIGYWVLREACRQAREWMSIDPDHPIVMSVNLSGRQLQRADVVDQVRAALDETGLSPRQLKLEITESVLMADQETAVARMRDLKALGVKLALDDFGTGYSSMASLHAFPVDNVKIDRAFVARLEDDEEASALVAAMILMARSLGIDVTGEGIETATQVAHLQELNCDLGQGYFFATPLPADEAGRMLAKKRPAFVQFHHPTQPEDIEELLQSLYDDQQRAA